VTNSSHTLLDFEQGEKKSYLSLFYWTSIYRLYTVMKRNNWIEFLLMSTDQQFLLTNNVGKIKLNRKKRLYRTL